MWCSATLFAQTPTSTPLAPWQQQQPLPQSHSLGKNYYAQVGIESVFFVNPSTGWATGRNGNILSTRDGGKTWTPEQSPVFRELVTQYFVTPELGWAGGFDGIIQTSNGGKTWSVQYREIDVRAMHFVSATTGWAVGGSGKIIATTDGGKTWTPQQSGKINQLNSVFFTSPMLGWAAGVDGIIATNDGGKTWAEQLNTTALNRIRLNNLWFNNSTTGWAVGGDSTLLITNDGGKTWIRRTIPVPHAVYRGLTDIHFVSSTTGWILAEDGSLFQTTDGGKTWAILTTFPSLLMNDIHFINELTGWASSGSDNVGVVWNTTDGGKTWVQQRSSRLLNLRAVNFINPTTGWAVGASTILKTNNGGSLWEFQGLPANVPADFRAASFLDYNTGWITGNASKVLQTNNGTTWEAASSGGLTILDSLLGVFFLDNNTGWVVGGTARGSFGIKGVNKVLATTDGGKTWTNQTPKTITKDAFHAVFFINRTKGWLVGAGGTILATQDGGTNWSAQNSRTTTDLRSVHFVNETVGWAAGGSDEAGLVLKTEDGGATWRRQLVPADHALRSLYFVNTSVGYAVGDKGTMIATRDGGNTWTLLDTFTGAHLYGVTFVNTLRGWAVGDSGVIFSTKNGGFKPEVQAGAKTLVMGIVPVGRSTTQTLSFNAKYLLEPLRIEAPEGFSLDFGNETNRRTITLQPDTLDAATSGTLTVRFSPVKDGLQTGFLQFSGAQVSLNIGIGGFGLNRATIRPNPTELAFDTVKMGTIKSKSLWLHNSGTVAAVIKAGTLKRPSADFTANLPSNTTVIQPNDSLEVLVSYKPANKKNTNPDNNTLELTVFDGRDSIISVPLSGVPGLALLDFEPDDRINFGSLSIGQTRTAGLALTNLGNISAKIDSIRVTGTTFRLLTSVKNFSVQPRQQLQLSIEFAPKRIGFFFDTLIVYSDAGIIGAGVFGRGEPLLAAPTLISPVNIRINVPVKPQFEWAAVDSAQFYEIQVSRDSTFTTIDYRSDSLRARGVIPDVNLLNNIFYFWRVRARNRTQTSEWSATYRFLTIRATVLLRVNPEPLELGKIPIGQKERLFFNVTPTANNVIRGYRWIAGDSSAFTILPDQFPVALARNRSTNIVFEFTPKEERQYIAVLAIISNDDFALVQFFAEGVQDSTALVTNIQLRLVNAAEKLIEPRDTVRPGEALGLLLQFTTPDPRRLSTSRDADRNRAKLQSFSAKLLVRNPSLLSVVETRPSFPSNATEDNMTVKGKIIELNNIPVDTTTLKNGSGKLATIRLLALQGDAATTGIEFLEFNWADEGAPAGTKTTIRNMTDNSVTLTVCDINGQPSYLRRTSGTAILSLNPNPTLVEAEMNFSIGSKTTVEIFLMDMLGRRVKTLQRGEMEPGEYQMLLDASTLSDGMYSVVIQTPFKTVQRQIGVVK